MLRTLTTRFLCKSTPSSFSQPDRPTTSGQASSHKSRLNLSDKYLSILPRLSDKGKLQTALETRVRGTFEPPPLGQPDA